MVGHLEHPIAFGYSRRVEIRPPRKGEEYFDDGKIQVAKVDHNDNSIVLERVRDPRIKLVLEEDWADYAIARPSYGDKYLNKHGEIETAKRYHKTPRIVNPKSGNDHKPRLGASANFPLRLHPEATRES